METKARVEPRSLGVRRLAILLAAVFAIGALWLLDLISLTTYGMVVPAAVVVLGAAGFWVAPRLRGVLAHISPDRIDLFVLGATYLGIVGFLSLAFRCFTINNTAGLFLSFAAALLLGAAWPVAYTVWIRKRPLRTLGIGRHNLGRTILLGLVFAAVQYFLTLYGKPLPAEAVDWVPLLVMSVAVGIFEAVFFRGFVQGRLEASFGTIPAIIGAAVLYALYHVGYGMGGSEMLFLFGLGVTYAVIYRTSRNILVVWPLLTPLGSFFNNIQAGDIELPWMSIAGFADVLFFTGMVMLFAWRYERKRARSLEEPMVVPAVAPVHR